MNEYIYYTNDDELDSFLHELDEPDEDIDELVQSAIEEERNYILGQIRAAQDDYLLHYGVAHDEDPPGRGSGRFPYGSGENPGQHQPYTLAKQVRELREQGLTSKQIAEGLGFKSTTQLRAHLSLEKDRQKLYLSSEVPRLRAQGKTIKEISERLGISDGSVRNYLDADRKIQIGKTTTVANALKAELETKKYLDIGAGVEFEIANGVSKERLKTAVEMLRAEGYEVVYPQIEQLGNPGKKTTMMTLCAKGVDKKEAYREINEDPSRIQPFTTYFVDNGASALGLQPVRSIDSNRVHIRYAEEVGPDGATGIQRDGMIQLRRGVDEVSLGKSRYAQVRIGVDDTHYMKGMAIYGDDSLFPEGCDIIYNTNKKIGTDKYDVFKEMKHIKNPDGTEGPVNQANPFGATVMKNSYDENGRITAGGQSYYISEDGTEKLRVINKVNDQGGWQEWSLSASPQLLSKQPREIIERQLKLTIEDRQAEYADIMSVSNETVRRKLLEDFREELYSSAGHLKAKAFPNQTTNVLISIPSLGDDECFCPNYPHGERLALIRFPHAGPQEIPIVRNNLKCKEAIDTIGMNAPDAIGLHPSQYPKLSGADSDGDSVVTIPLSTAKIQSKPIFQGLQDFDTKIYKYKDPDAPWMTSQQRGNEMGKATNLIADMGLLGAKPEEIERAVKYSMVVVDALKHHLDYKKAYKDLNIRQLKIDYQGGANRGAVTFVTRAGSEDHVPEYKTYGIDPETGRDITKETGEKYYTKVTPKKKEPYLKEHVKTQTQDRIQTIRLKGGDAKELLSSKTNPHPTEVLYAEYANELIRMGNEVGKQLAVAPKLKYSPSAAKEYAAQVASINSKLVAALKNAPRERQAQALGTARFNAIVEQNPSLLDDKAEKKKVRGQCITQAREDVHAKKPFIKLEPPEIEAINAGAISDSKLKQILDNSDMDIVRKAFQTKTKNGISESMESLARSMALNGYSNADIASRLGVSTSTVSKILNA